jgi:YidC/Oxa1 family membrane protein insertase
MNPLTPIENILTAVLEWLHASVGLPGAWAIVALTLMVRIVILPLTIKQIRSMQRLQIHAPELKAIQQKYKHDKQKMNEEVMKFYRENNVNPLASCLPIVLQIPIFFALFYVLKDFEKEVFPQYPDSDLGWLNIVPNITQDISTHWSGWLLLVVYVASQLASTYFMSSTMDPRQRYIFLALPFLFIFFVINFPVGLMLYWSTTNLWTVGQGLVTRRLVPKPQPPPKRTSRTPPKAAPEPEPPETAAKADAEPDTTPAKTGGSGQQRVRRRKKKKGPRARR